jgi:pimeloyl-ACP methyl ester carboxylesterase
LVLLGANGGAGRDSSQTRRAAQWALAQQDGLHALAHSKLAPGYGLAEDDAALDTLVAQAEGVSLPRFANQLAYAAQRPGLLAPRQTLNMPVLALSAEHDTLCPPAHSDEIVALVAPQHLAQHHCLAGAGHLFPMQHAAWAAAHLHTFLTHLKAPRP